MTQGNFHVVSAQFAARMHGCMERGSHHMSEICCPVMDANKGAIGVRGFLEKPVVETVLLRCR